MNNGYDIFGDIHGHADELEYLLKQLGYENRQGSYRCPGRQAVFVGDLIDRGKQNKKAVSIVRAMVDSGNGRAVMGNHEYNAICYHTINEETGQPLRSHSDKNTDQHKEFLQEFAEDSAGCKETIEWFKELPLYLTLDDGPRIIHACWHPDQIESLQDAGCSKAKLNHEQFHDSATKGSATWEAVEILLKGTETRLPSGLSFRDKDNNERFEIRTRWWETNPGSYRDMAMVPEELMPIIPDTRFPSQEMLGYPAHETPVFFGHYWLTGQPATFADNVCCLDYSVGKQGSLCCYRWNGETVLSPDNFISVKGLY